VNTEEVCKMIDDITEGRPKQVTWEGDAGEYDSITLRTISGAFQFTQHGNGAFVFQSDDPRTAREIAGALVAWANRKDGVTSNRNVQSDLLSEKKEKDVAIWRENWYHRNIRNMTRETMERNMSDLQKIRRSTPFPSDEFDDIQKAIDILHVALNGGNNDGV
jgi:hypothetical protein